MVIAINKLLQVKVTPKCIQTINNELILISTIIKSVVLETSLVSDEFCAAYDKSLFLCDGFQLLLSLVIIMLSMLLGYTLLDIVTFYSDYLPSTSGLSSYFCLINESPFLFYSSEQSLIFTPSRKF